MRLNYIKFVLALLLVCALPLLIYASESTDKSLSNPKTMVLMGEYIDNMPQPSATISTQIEARFIDNNFDLVDRGQVKRLNLRDAELYAREDSTPIIGGTISTKGSADLQSNLINKSNIDVTKETSGTIYSFKDPANIAMLAKGVGADILVLGMAICNLKEAHRPYGLTTYTYEAQIDIKAISTDNARVLAVDTLRGSARDSTRLTAADKALQGALSMSMDPFIKKIADAWGNKDGNETRVELICYNATFKKSKELRKAVLAIKGVKAIDEKSLINNVLELNIVLIGDNDRFADSLSEVNNPKIEITSKTPGRVYIKFLP